MGATKKAKLVLSEYRAVNQRMLDIIEERTKLYSLLDVGSIGFESDGSSKGSSDVDKRTKIHVRLADIDAELEEEKLKCIEKLHQTMNLIRLVPETNQQTVLKMRYINGYTWEFIAVNMGYTIRQIYNIHGKALQAVSKHV